jgi:transcriptional regulator with XRE-family HTH domain
MMTLLPTSLGARLRAHRRQLGMTQEYCALVLGLSTSVLQRLERDAPPWLTLAQQQRLAHVLGCSRAALGLPYPTTRPRRATAGRAPDAPPGPAPISFGQRLRALRREHGWSQTHLGHLLGVCHTVISRLENDRTLNPRLRFVYRLARALHCSTDALLGREEDAAQACAPSADALAAPLASAAAAPAPRRLATARAGRGASQGEIRR